MTTLQIKLTPHSNILDGITLYEKIDPVALNKLIHSDLLMTTEWNKGNRFINHICHNEKQQLEKYHEKCKNEKVPVTYKKVKGNPFERSDPEHSLSLFTIRRQIRHTISKAFYVDIDIKNCHPEMLYQICKENKIQCSLLEQYVKNRQFYLDMVMNEYSCGYDQAKVLFIVILYGGGFNRWAKDNIIEKPALPIILEFKAEFTAIAEEIMRKNLQIAEAVIKRKTDQGKTEYNLAGSTCAYFLQEYEVRILETLFKYCVENQIICQNCAVLCADGLMIEKEFYNPLLLSTFHDIVYEKFGFDLQFTTKDMNEDYLDILDDHIVLLEKDCFNITKEEVEDPFSASLVLSKSLKKTLKLCKENWFMLCSNNLWKQQKEPSFYIIKEMHKYLDTTRESLNQQISNTEGDTKQNFIKKMETWLKFYTNITKPGYLSVLTKCLRPLLADDEFINKLDNNKGKLAFKNGIMDLESKIFREGILWDDFITQTIPYDYKPSKFTFVKSKLKEILNNNEEHLEYFLSVIGYSFIGQPDLEKSIYFMVDKTDGGNGDNGKTFYFDIMNDLMPNYVYRTKSTLIENNNSKVHKQLVMTKGKRLVWLEELPKEQDTNAVLMKEVGDGKTLENEVMFGTSETINIMFKMFALSNHCPKINPNESAVYNRFKQISFNSHFDRTGTRTEPNPEELKFIADTSLSTTIKEQYYDEVFNMIIHYANMYYSRKLPAIPQQFLKDTKETQDQNDEFGCWFKEHCERAVDGKLPIKLLVTMSSMNEKKVKEGMARNGFKYNKDLSGMGKDDYGKHYKGGYQGVNYIHDKIDEDDN